MLDGPFFSMSDPSFWYQFLFLGEGAILATAFFFCVLFLHRSTVLLATAFFCSLCYRVRDILLVLCFKLNNQFQALFNLKMVLLTIRRFDSSILTASVVRYYTATQSCLTAAVFPSVLSANLMLLLLSLCSGEFRKIDSILDTQCSCYLPSVFAICNNIANRQKIWINWDCYLINITRLFDGPGKCVHRDQIGWLSGQRWGIEPKSEIQFHKTETIVTEAGRPV